MKIMFLYKNIYKLNDFAKPVFFLFLFPCLFSVESCRNKTVGARLRTCSSYRKTAVVRGDLWEKPSMSVSHC